MPSDLDKSPGTRKAVSNFTIHQGSSSPPDSVSASASDQFSRASLTKGNASRPSLGEAALPLRTSRMVNCKANVYVPGPADMSPHENSSSPSSASLPSPAGSRLVHNATRQSPVTTESGTLTGRKDCSIGSIESHGDNAELRSLRKQLEAANIKIAAMDRELANQRVNSLSSNKAVPSPTQVNFFSKNNSQIAAVQPANTSNHNQLNYGNSGYLPRSSEPTQVPWADNKVASRLCNNSSIQMIPPAPGTASAVWGSSLPSSASTYEYRTIPPPPTPQPTNAPQPQRHANISVDTWTANQQLHPGPGDHVYDQIARRGYGSTHRPGSAMSGSTFYQSNNSFAGSVPATPVGFSPPLTPMQMQQMNMMPTVPNTYGVRIASNELSPTALEFDASAMQNMNSGPHNSWSNPGGAQDNTSMYVSPGEPTNYRRLLDRNMNCNWKHIVDKIVCNNDQQASIFLQQKLKLSGPDEKFELVEAIVAQAYLLMVNRFGNFLIQRCFEHGTQEQVIGLANAIRGNTLNLSMDAFGCHVVQKAFDVVPEEYKAMMVHELLTRIPETVIHRYACHVWQKLFELRWSDSPPQIMKFVNEALRGMWHEVALGETGSLVVQNIFENCLEEDKRPCVNEVLASIDIIAHGQFGNWCIQHICEHGLPADKSRAVEHVLRFANEYSIDQFASKVVEKCLKIGGSEFTERYLERVCEGRSDRPRMPLIDIAGDQYGNYLIQYILINGNPQHREIVSSHVRKHMVSLRGSKFGSRVAMLCSNPAFTTRPGAPAGMQPNNRYIHGMGLGRGSLNASFR